MSWIFAAIILSFSANAKGNPMACPEMQALQAKYKTELNPQVPRDQKRGADEISKVVDCVDNAAKLRDDKGAFEDLIELVAWALPFDYSNDLAETTAYLVNQPDLLKRMDAEVAKISDRCRKENFLVSVYGNNKSGGVCEANSHDPVCRSVPKKQDMECLVKLNPPGAVTN